MSELTESNDPEPTAAASEVSSEPARSEVRTSEPAPAKRRRSVWGWIALFLVGGMLLSVLTMGYLAYRLSQAIGDVPEFYAQVEVATAEEQQVRVRQVEQTARRLIEPRPVPETQDEPAALPAEPSTTLEFTESQLNAWLAAELSPGTLPKEIQAPRIRLLDGHALLGVRVQRPEMTGVVTLDIEPQSIDEQAIRFYVTKATVGSIPLPIDRLLGMLDPAAIELPPSVMLDRESNPPSLTFDWSELNKDVRIDAARLQDGLLLVTPATR